MLEGSIRRAGDRIRITARLVDGATGAQVWAERYDRTLDDIFAVQDDITHQIVAALQVNLLPTEKAALARPPTTNIEAYGDYLRGLELLRQPRQAVLHGSTTDVRASRGSGPELRSRAGGDRGVRLPSSTCFSASQCLLTMFWPLPAGPLQLEPDLASAHASRGVALLATGRAEEAERSFQHAIAAEPDHAHGALLLRPRLRRAGPKAGSRAAAAPSRRPGPGRCRLSRPPAGLVSRPSA